MMKNHTLQMEEEEVKLQGEVCFNSTPPSHIYRGVTPFFCRWNGSLAAGTDLVRQWHVSTWLVEVVGPTGLVCRPGWSAGQPMALTSPNFREWAVLAVLLSK